MLDRSGCAQSAHITGLLVRGLVQSALCLESLPQVVATFQLDSHKQLHSGQCPCAVVWLPYQLRPVRGHGYKELACSTQQACDPSWMQADDSRSRHASQVQALKADAAAAAKKAALDSQAELKKVCMPTRTYVCSWLICNVSLRSDSAGITACQTVRIVCK